MLAVSAVSPLYSAPSQPPRLEAVPTDQDFIAALQGLGFNAQQADANAGESMQHSLPDGHEQQPAKGTMYHLQLVLRTLVAVCTYKNKVATCGINAKLLNAVAHVSTLCYTPMLHSETLTGRTEMRLRPPGQSSDLRGVEMFRHQCHSADDMLCSWLGQLFRKHHSFTVTTAACDSQAFLPVMTLTVHGQASPPGDESWRSCFAGQSCSLACKLWAARAAPDASGTADGSCRTTASRRDTGVPACPCPQWTIFLTGYR